MLLTLLPRMKILRRNRSLRLLVPRTLLYFLWVLPHMLRTVGLGSVRAAESLFYVGQRGDFLGAGMEVAGAGAVAMVVVLSHVLRVWYCIEDVAAARIPSMDFHERPLLLRWQRHLSILPAIILIGTARRQIIVVPRHLIIQYLGWKTDWHIAKLMIGDCNNNYNFFSKNFWPKLSLQIKNNF